MARLTYDNYARFSFEFMETLASLEGADEIRAAIMEAIKPLGFEYATGAAVPGPGQSPMEGVLLNNRPADYVAHYVSKNYTEIDPIVTEVRQNLRPFSWGDVRSTRVLTKKQLSIIDEGKEFQAHDGLVIPIVTYTGSISIFSPCGDDPDLSPRARSAIEIIGFAGMQALRRSMASKQRQHPQQEHLTPREREVVHWLAVGKTDFEIGEILGISPETVKSHVENSKRKLNAARRTLIVVEALRRGEISI
jgi:DNA-binding CsgD family transcriptional regulator